MEGTQHPPPIDASRLVGPPSAPPPKAPTADEGAADDAGAAPEGQDPFAERPELYVGAAFAGGIVLAGLLRLLSR